MDALGVAATFIHGGFSIHVRLATLRAITAAQVVARAKIIVVEYGLAKGAHRIIGAIH